MAAHSTVNERSQGISNPAYSSTDERFWSKVDASGDCWLWSAGRVKAGYGCYSVWLGEGKVVAHYAHRYAYRNLVGEVPNGLDLDHLCRNRLCVNPDHLEPVSRRENLRRSGATHVGTKHCPKGHPYDEANTYVFVRKGQGPCRRCRECFRLYMAAYDARRRKGRKTQQEAPMA